MLPLSVPLLFYHGPGPSNHSLTSAAVVYRCRNNRAPWESWHATSDLWVKNHLKKRSNINISDVPPLTPISSTCKRTCYMKIRTHCPHNPILGCLESTTVTVTPHRTKITKATLSGIRRFLPARLGMNMAQLPTDYLPTPPVLEREPPRIDFKLWHTGW